MHFSSPSSAGQLGGKREEHGKVNVEDEQEARRVEKGGNDGAEEYCKVPLIPRVVALHVGGQGGYEGLQGALVGKGQGGRRQRSDKGIKLKAKYVGPNGETYTGRGPTPKWLRTLERKGEKREKFLVK